MSKESATVVTLLSPLDVRPGAKDPDGRTVARAKLYFDGVNIVVDAAFDDGTERAFLWPSGKGWTVDGRTGE